MNIFCDINYNNIAVRIKENKYTEINHFSKTITKLENSNTISNSNTFLLDEIFTRYDIEFCNSNNKDIYREQIKIKIASKIDEESDKYYDCFKYKKSFSKKMIQSGLQSCNKLSSILYLIDLYKCNIVIHDMNENKYICLSSKYENTDIYSYDNCWKYEKTVDNNNNINYERYSKDHKYFEYDIKTIYIYDTTLKPIHNYKLEELENLAKDKNIDTMNNGKKLTKKCLYDILYYMYI